MTAIPPELARELRATLRENSGRFVGRFYRRELLLARTVRGMQIEAQQEFDREVIRPLLRTVGANLAGFRPRGNDVLVEFFPELARLEEEIGDTVSQGSDAVRRLATERLEELSRAEAEFVTEAGRDGGVEIIRGAGPVPLADVLDRPFLGNLAEDRFEALLEGPDGTGNTVRAWVQTGIQRGLTTDEIVGHIRGSGGQAGLLEAKRNDVAALVRTAAAHVSAQSRMESFRGIGVDTWRFVATLDLRTSAICASNDGKTFPVGEGPVPPLHPNCRSTAVPDFGDDDPGAKRAAVGGQVPASTTYQDWLKQQPKGDQDRMLGRTKAAAWRRGDLTFERMVGRDLQPLTLAELRKLDRV